MTLEQIVETLVKSREKALNQSDLETYFEYGSQTTMKLNDCR